MALTGATGFVGSNILKVLVSQGWQVRALTRRTHNDNHDNEGIKWITGDLHNESALLQLVQNVNAVVHCAGIVRGRSASEFEHVNTQGSANLLQAIIQNQQSPRFLMISSLAARYPEYSWYAASKYEAEQLLNQQITDTIPCTIFRPTALYGPGDREVKPMLNAMRYGILTTPGKLEQRISLLHIDDLTSAITGWLKKSEPVSGTFELDDGHVGGYSWENLAQIAEEVWQRRVYRIPVPIRLLKTFAQLNLSFSSLFNYSPMLTPGKINEITHSDWVCDNNALTQTFDWQPQVKLREAMRKACLTSI